MRRGQQQGFTMIELIMVIVILGVLSAFALPRFADLGGSARAAAVEGLGGSIRSSLGISRAAYLATGGTGTTVTLDGVDVNVVGGYPGAVNTGTTTIDVDGMIAAAGLADNAGADSAFYVEGDYAYVGITNGMVIGITSIMDTDANGTVSAAEAVAGTSECRVTYTQFIADPAGDGSLPATPPSVVVAVDDCG